MLDLTDLTVDAIGAAFGRCGPERLGVEMELGKKKTSTFAMTSAAGLALAALVAAPTAAAQEYVCTDGPAAECHSTGGAANEEDSGGGGNPYGPFYHQSRHGVNDPAHRAAAGTP